MNYDPTSESAGMWQRQVLVFSPCSVNKQTTKCEMKYFDKKLEDYTLCAQKRKIEFDYTPLRMNG